MNFNFFESFSIMMKQRYPIFCSVFDEAMVNEDIENYKNAEELLDDIQNPEENFNYVSNIEDTNEVIYYNSSEPPIQSFDDFQTGFTQEDDPEFAHDLEKVAALIDKMVISAQPF